MCWDRFSFLWTLYRAYERVSGAAAAAAAATAADIEPAAGPEIQPGAVQLHAAMNSSSAFQASACLTGNCAQPNSCHVKAEKDPDASAAENAQHVDASHEARLQPDEAASSKQAGSQPQPALQHRNVQSPAVAAQITSMLHRAA